MAKYTSKPNLDNRKTTNKNEVLDEILKDDSPIPEDSENQEPVEEPVEEPTDDEDAEDQDETTTDDEDVEEDSETEVDETKKPVDYEKRYKDSSREAMALHFKNQKMSEKITEATNLSEPTEEELREHAFKNKGDWDLMDDFSKSLLKESLMNSRKLSLISEANQETKEVGIWERKLTDYINSPEVVAKYPDIGDEETTFKKFCMSESRRGMDMDDLLSLFLFHKENEETKPQKKRKSMLLTGGGGDKAPKPKKATADKAKATRLSDEKEYRRKIKAGEYDLDLLEGE